METIRRLLLAFYILTLMTFGFWINYASFSLIIDVAGFLLVVFSLFYIRGKITITKNDYLLFGEVIIFFLGIFIITLISISNDLPIRMCVLGFRDYFEFMLLGFIIICLIPNEDSYNKFLGYITTFTIFMCSFGIVQFIFHGSLPDELLHVRSGRLDYVYGLGDLIFRINGLFENSIVFNGIIVISSALTFGTILVKGKTFARLFGFGIAVAANVLTFSRVAIVGSIMVYSVEYLLLGESSKLGKYIKLLAVGSLGIFGFLTFGSGTALYQRLFNSSITAASDLVHRTTILEARNAVSDHWLLGLGMGTQGYDSAESTVSIIRDGCWLQFALEIGTPLTILFGIILITLVVVAYKKLKKSLNEDNRIVCGVFISITLYFVIASFVNSAFNAKEVFGLYWVLAGMALWKIQYKTINT